MIRNACGMTMLQHRPVVRHAERRAASSWPRGTAWIRPRTSRPCRRRRPEAERDRAVRCRRGQLGARERERHADADAGGRSAARAGRGRTRCRPCASQRYGGTEDSRISASSDAEHEAELKPRRGEDEGVLQRDREHVGEHLRQASRRQRSSSIVIPVGQRTAMKTTSTRTDHPGHPAPECRPASARWALSLPAAAGGRVESHWTPLWPVLGPGRSGRGLVPTCELRPALADPLVVDRV